MFTDRNSPSLYRPMDPILCVLCRRPNPTPESSACPTCVPPDEGEIRTTANRDIAQTMLNAHIPEYAFRNAGYVKACAMLWGYFNSPETLFRERFSDDVPHTADGMWAILKRLMKDGES